MKSVKGEHPFGDAGQIILFALFLIVWILDSFILHQSTFLAQHIPLGIRLIILVLALVAAVYLINSGHRVVSGDQRPEEIISSGAFRYVRHPLYLGTMLAYLGLTVSTASLFCLALLVFIVLFYHYIAGYEEKLLEIKFGESYIAYQKQTGKWVPQYRKKRQ